MSTSTDNNACCLLLAFLLFVPTVVVVSQSSRLVSRPRSWRSPLSLYLNLAWTTVVAKIALKLAKDALLLKLAS